MMATKAEIATRGIFGIFGKFWQAKMQAKQEAKVTRQEIKQVNKEFV